MKGMYVPDQRGEEYIVHEDPGRLRVEGEEPDLGTADDGARYPCKVYDARGKLLRVETEAPCEVMGEDVDTSHWKSVDGSSRPYLFGNNPTRYKNKKGGWVTNTSRRRK